MSALLADVLFEALANGLWRGAVLTLTVALLLRMFRWTTAAERYAVWLAVLMVIALAPAAEVVVRSIQPVEAAAPLAVIDTTLAVSERAPTGTGSVFVARWRPVEVAAAPFLLLWLAVGVFFAVRLWRRCSLASELKRSSAAPGPELAAAVEAWERGLTARRVGVTRVSRRLRTPAAVGWLTPEVLLPSCAATEVRDGDLEMLWKHEQAHVSRRDDWTQLFAEVMVAAAWFHPAAYWVGRRLKEERELACDEAVLAGGVSAHRYAGALGRWAERAAMSELPAGAMALGRSRALIIRRIEMLLSPSRNHRRNGGRLAFAATLVGCVAAAGLFILGGPTAIRAQSPVTDADVEVEQPDVAVEVADPIVVVPTVQAEVRVDVRTPVVQVDVVDPVLLSQAAPPAPSPADPVPPTPPAPSVALTPPTPPVPAVPPARPNGDRREQSRAMDEHARRWREQMRPELEAIQQEAQRMRQYVRENFAPQQEKLQALAQQLAEEHRKTIRPLAEKMAQLGAKMGQAFDAEQRDELRKQMDQVAKRMEERGPEFQRLEEAMNRIRIGMGPFEQRMEELSEALRQKQEALEETRREFEESRK